MILYSPNAAYSCGAANNRIHMHLATSHTLVLVYQLFFLPVMAEKMVCRSSGVASNHTGAYLQPACVSDGERSGESSAATSSKCSKVDIFQVHTSSIIKPLLLMYPVRKPQDSIICTTFIHPFPIPIPCTWTRELYYLERSSRFKLQQPLVLEF